MITATARLVKCRFRGPGWPVLKLPSEPRKEVLKGRMKPGNCRAGSSSGASDEATPVPSAKVRGRALPKGDFSNVLITSVKAFQGVQSGSFRARRSQEAF